MSNNGNNKNSNKSGLVFILIGAVIGVIWGVISYNDSKFDKYYNAKVKACPTRTLKQGLEKIAQSLGTSEDYKVYEAEAKSGRLLVYLEFYGYYTPITYSDGTVSFGTVYNRKTNQVEYSYTFIENLLCD